MAKYKSIVGFFNKPDDQYACDAIMAYTIVEIGLGDKSGFLPDLLIETSDFLQVKKIDLLTGNVLAIVQSSRIALPISQILYGKKAKELEALIKEGAEMKFASYTEVKEWLSQQGVSDSAMSSIPLHTPISTE